jgi:hypothetical protein
MKTSFASLAFVQMVDARNDLSETPPMGWMSWMIYRCRIDCAKEPDDCISETLFKAQADAMVENGFLDAGYTSMHMDDCWEQKNPPRDPETNKLVGDPTRFPSGMKALGDYYHSKGLKYGLYTAESEKTCGGYPGSKENEEVDAQTFAEWGVDYIKVDGCGLHGDTSYYDYGYQAMGEALEESGRPIEYSCSWPACINHYHMANETVRQATFIKMINYGCNGWRNWHDIMCNWKSLGSIIDHWGTYGASMQPFAGPGHWHDMDMLLIGSISEGYDGGKAGERCVSLVEEQTQMAIWAISASPLIMGNDMRKVANDSLEILFNEHAIAVSQDPLGQMGIRLTGNTSSQIWARKMGNGDVAVALYNRDDAAAGVADITVQFNMTGINLYTDVDVFDIWDKKSAGTFSKEYTAKAVPSHGTAFLRLSAAQATIV